MTLPPTIDASLPPRLNFARSDTILSWNEPETGVDYALSFQEPDGCTEVWEQICAVQGRSADEAGYELKDASMAAQGGAGGLGAEGGVGGAASELITLPACELRNLAAISELLGEVP